MTLENFHTQYTEPRLIKESAPTSLPERIGPYKIEGLLNKGGMSWLYMGIHPETKKPLAIKVLPQDHLENKELVDQFLQEAQIISLTNHPNIVKLYGEGTWEKGLYIAMEWVHGISLRQFLTQQSFSLKRSLEIILQVSFALRHLHSHKVIHRDLKPENILITEDGEIKVIDFGIAQLVHSPHTSGSIMGTPNYMSPEQKEDSTKATYSSDIYALGVIAYELITGKLSYGMIQLSLLPRHLRKIIGKAMAVSLSERYQAISELIHDISQYLRSTDIEKEKPEQDRVKELLEIFQKASYQLSPFPSPSWPSIEIGIAKHKALTKFGLYYDLFRLPGNHFFFLMIDPLEQDLEALFAVASLRGSIKAFMAEHLQNISSSFSPLSLLNKLQWLLKQDPFLPRIALSFLYLDPLLDRLSFFNAGLSQLIHVPNRGSPHILRNSNPLLMSELALEPAQTVENWNPGDLIVFHSLAPQHTDSADTRHQKEQFLEKIVKEDAFLSAQPQSESILRKALEHSLFSSLKQAQAIITIQRTV